MISSHQRSALIHRQSPKSHSAVRLSHMRASTVFGSGKLSKQSAGLLLKQHGSSTAQDQVEGRSSELNAGGLVVGPRPVKRKVIETEVEPPSVEGSQSSQAVEMYFSAVVDFCKFELKAQKLQFQDTLVFESRICK